MLFGMTNYMCEFLHEIYTDMLIYFIHFGWHAYRVLERLLYLSVSFIQTLFTLIMHNMWRYIVGIWSCKWLDFRVTDMPTCSSCLLCQFSLDLAEIGTQIHMVAISYIKFMQIFVINLEKFMFCLTLQMQFKAVMGHSYIYKEGSNLQASTAVLMCKSRPNKYIYNLFRSYMYTSLHKGIVFILSCIFMWICTHVDRFTHSNVHSL